ncbi:hypothetical protein IQ454_003608 [Salmonella enterica]|nr:hypothetical protein [Salmonella enterica]EGL4349454.1 hypothetical protein [Salmonella enterica]EGL4359145.1 hypothetical protein [Salmonella enterica]EGL4381694.1 hypothetical protein [Salmonella enterica]EGL4487073.1 hypothetical protein [Salmonella enterica]
MKDDYHLPVITRLEREARRAAVQKTKLAMVLGLTVAQYNKISDGWEELRAGHLTSYAWATFTSMGFDLFYVFTGVYREGLCLHCREKFINRWVNDMSPAERHLSDHLVTRIRYER